MKRANMTSEEGYRLLSKVQEIASPWGSVTYGSGSYRVQITNWTGLEDCSGDPSRQKAAYEAYQSKVRAAFRAALKVAGLEHVKTFVNGWNGAMEVGGDLVQFGYPYPPPQIKPRGQVFNPKQAALYLTVNYGEVAVKTLYKQIENDKLKAEKIAGKWEITQAECDRYGLENLGKPGAPTGNWNWKGKSK